MPIVKYYTAQVCLSQGIAVVQIQKMNALKKITYGMRYLQSNSLLAVSKEQVNPFIALVTLAL